MAQLTNPTLAALLTELEQVQQAIWFLNRVCDAPDDRLYRARDDSWWKREGLTWRQADPPKGWVKQP